MQSSLSQISITTFQSKTYKTVILTCTLSLFALIIFSDHTISKPEFSTCATFLEPPCHVKKRGFHILLQDIFLICFSTQNNENKFYFLSNSIAKDRGWKIKKTKQLLSNHWGLNQTPEFCTKIKKVIKYRVYHKEDYIGPSMIDSMVICNAPLSSFNIKICPLTRQLDQM